MSEVIIVGAGHGAGQVVASLQQKKYDGRICLVGEESWYPYQRPPLSKKFLAGEMQADRLYFKPVSFYDAPNIDVRLGTRVTGIDPAKKSVMTDGGETLSYDNLVLATGSRARQLDVPGSDLDGIHYLRGIDDVNSIRSEMEKYRKLTIVGAGYIGLEVAAVAARLGLDVTVVETEDRVMSRVVSPVMSLFYQDVHREEGVELMLSTGVNGFRGGERVEAVILDNGAELAADLVIIGIGIVPNAELAEDAGLSTADGIIVDDHCRTSGANVYAIGDCTWHPNPVLDVDLRLESVHNALEQAKVAAANICGQDATYAQVPWFWSDQYDLKLQIAGLSQGYDQVVVRGDRSTRAFSCLYLKDGVLISVDAINAPKDFVQAKPLIAAHARIDPEMLANPEIQLKDMA